jgi:hypothetical protein
MTSVLPDAIHHQSDSPGPPIFLSTLSEKISAHTKLCDFGHILTTRV